MFNGSGLPWLALNSRRRPEFDIQLQYNNPRVTAIPPYSPIRTPIEEACWNLQEWNDFRKDRARQRCKLSTSRVLHKSTHCCLLTKNVAHILVEIVWDGSKTRLEVYKLSKSDSACLVSRLVFQALTPQGLSP